MNIQIENCAKSVQYFWASFTQWLKIANLVCYWNFARIWFISTIVHKFDLHLATHAASKLNKLKGKPLIILKVSENTVLPPYPNQL